MLTQYGKPFSRKALASRFSDWADQAGLPKICSAHVVRKALATILANQEATTEELKATFGWSTSKQADVYTAQANKTKLGTSGLERIRNSSVPPAPSKVSHPSD
ncbi:MAG: integrase [Rhodospirillaceae bacterium]|nr:MAG: integrase [Rhodospirillaceae bacterium]